MMIRAAGDSVLQVTSQLTELAAGIMMVTVLTTGPLSRDKPPGRGLRPLPGRQ